MIRSVVQFFKLLPNFRNQDFLYSGLIGQDVARRAIVSAQKSIGANIRTIDVIRICVG